MIFLKSETQYIGLKISATGIQPRTDKVKDIRSVALTAIVGEVRVFIGMCSYYRIFIPRFSRLAESLITLTRKHARFRWDYKCQESFDRMSESVTLMYPGPNKEYKLYTDVSDLATGGCLTQQIYDEQNQ